EACASALRSGGIEAAVVDCMELLGGAGSVLGAAVFRKLLSVPSVYDAFHFGHLRTGDRVARWMQEASDRRLVPALRRLVDKGDKGDKGAKDYILLSVFPTGVSAAARLKAERPELAAFAVCTDACVHRLWVADGIDGYIVCSPLAAATLRSYDPGAVVATLPAPVRAGFYDAPDQRIARESLGIPAGEPCILLMAGAWGLAPLADAAVALTGAGYWVLAVAGENHRLHMRLSVEADRNRRLLPFGFTDRVPELMAAADAVVTSPGQTCNEARVVGRPLLILDVVPGHGRENMLHEIETGGALVSSAEPDLMVSSVQRLFTDAPELAPWPVRSAVERDRQFGGAIESFGITGRPRSHGR
ncbi:MAG: glycosyltransferase family protein, partial [Acidimicrobiales bacterium]